MRGADAVQFGVWVKNGLGGWAVGAGGGAAGDEEQAGGANACDAGKACHGRSRFESMVEVSDRHSRFHKTKTHQPGQQSGVYQ